MLKDNGLKVFAKSYGCQMNVYDSTRMVDILAAENFSETDKLEHADLVILNTCHIRERATEKVYSELGRVNEIKVERAKKGLKTTIAVAGCVAQAVGSEIIRRQPGVDIVIGTQSYHLLPEALKQSRSQPVVVLTDFDVVEKFERLVPPSNEKISSRGISSFVTIQEGCDKFCSFCVVPYTRGAESSRPPRQILREIEQLADAGVREVTLLGQNVNAYFGADAEGSASTFVQLIANIASVRGIDRIRYTTSHPCDMSPELISAHSHIPQLMPYIHLPVQSGSDKVLKAMNRKHTCRQYLDCVDALRKSRSDIAISSDFIVGYPGETDADFEATLELVRKVGFAGAYSFKYSNRPGTPASKAGLQVEEHVKIERLTQLQTLLAEQSQSFNSKIFGTIVEVLFEKPGRRPGQIGGRTPHLQAVYADGPETLIGQVRKVEIVFAGPGSFKGRLVEGRA